MRFEFLRNYEHNLVVSAINEIADKMLAKGYGHDEILELVGVDISKR